MSSFPVSNNFLDILKNWSPKLSGLSQILEDFINQHNWKDYDAPITCSGNMIFTVGDFKEFRYLRVRNTVWFTGGANGTTSGTNSNDFIIPTPIPAREANNTSFSATIFESASSRRGAFGLITGGGDSITIRKYDQTNVGLGADRRFMISGFYEVL